jgi:hypothetical protein
MSLNSLSTRRSTGYKPKDPSQARLTPVLGHEGHWTEMFDRLEKELESINSLTRRQREAFSGKLFQWLTDPRSIYFGMLVTADKNPAPGPDGLSLRETWKEAGKNVMWEWSRSISEDLRNGTYVPSSPAEVEIAKTHGTRTISVFNHEDAAIQRALLGTIHAILDRYLLDSCEGGRLGRGAWTARRRLMKHVNETGSQHVVIQDLKGAFDFVPIQRLLQIIQKRIPCAQTIDLIKLILTSQPRKHCGRGIAQGAVISPTLLNTYLDHCLDRKIIKVEGVNLAIRYVDDILLSVDGSSAQRVNKELNKLIVETGFKPKYPTNDAVHDLEKDSAKWLGHNLRVIDGQLRFNIRNESWKRLRVRLGKCAEEEQATIAIKNWLNDAAASAQTPASTIASRICAIQREYRQRALVSEDEVMDWLNHARDRWNAFISEPSSSVYVPYYARKLAAHCSPEKEDGDWACAEGDS